MLTKVTDDFFIDLSDISFIKKSPSKPTSYYFVMKSNPDAPIYLDDVMAKALLKTCGWYCGEETHQEFFKHKVVSKL
jgi:hypothetical protein